MQSKGDIIPHQEQKKPKITGIPKHFSLEVLQFILNIRSIETGKLIFSQVSSFEQGLITSKITNHKSQPFTPNCKFDPILFGAPPLLSLSLPLAILAGTHPRTKNLYCLLLICMSL